MSLSTILAKRQAHLAALRSIYADLKSRIIEQTRLEAPDQIAEAAARRQSAAQMMSIAAQDAVNQLAALAGVAQDAGRSKRHYQVTTGDYRTLPTPDRLMSAFVVMLGWLLELIFTTVGLFADGHMDIVPALGFAATFATTNVGLGLAAGLYCLRYVGYRIDSPTPRGRDALIRKLAWAGFSAIVVLDVVMIAVAGRVRVTGGHDEIWDLDNVPIADTFGDGIGLVIMVFAALSFTLSTIKGRSGFTSADPEHAANVGRTGEDIAAEADWIADATRAEIEEIYDKAEADIQAIWGDPDDQMALLADVLDFNVRVEDAKDELLVFAQSERDRLSYLEGAEVAGSLPDLTAFDDLLIDPDTLTFSGPEHAELDRLRQAHAEANTVILTAFANFTTATQDTRILTPVTPTTSKKEV